MIRTVYSSDLISFKSFGFHPGLNILLADKSEGATNKQSRNGAGKSSFVELIHFYLDQEPIQTVFLDIRKLKILILASFLTLQELLLK